MSQSATKTATAQERTVELIKSAQVLLKEHESALKSATDKISNYEADNKAAHPLVESLIEKMASTRVNGELLLDPQEKTAALTGLSSKLGVADVAVQLVDILAKVGESSSKNAADLGEAADVRDIGRPLTGFGSLRSSSLQM